MLFTHFGVTTGITQGFRVIPEVTPKLVNNTNVHSKFTLFSLFSKIHSLKSEHIHSFLYREYGLLQLITTPTRITNTSSTLLDHIYTNVSAYYMYQDAQRLEFLTIFQFMLYLKTLTVNPLKRSQNIFEISGNFQKINFVMTYQMRNGEKFMTVLIQMKRMNFFNFIICF